MIEIYRKWDMKPVVEISNVCVNAINEGKLEDVPITVHGQDKLYKVKFGTF